MKKILHFFALLFSVVLLAQDGSIDTSFDPQTGANATIYKMSLQNDGKVLITGSFTSYNNNGISNIARVNSNGQLDSSFNLYPRFGNTVSSITAQRDGKYLISGYFTSVDGVPRNKIARLNADESLDETFVPKIPESVYNLSKSFLQPDGKVLVLQSDSGSFGNQYYFARLNANGSYDSAFHSNEQFVIFTTLAFLPNGKIIFGGRTNYYTGDYIKRLNVNGSTDGNFASTSYIIYAIQIQNDGKVLIAGDFETYNGVVIKRIARANSDGTLDGTFNPGLGANGVIYSMILQEDGKILIAGDFTMYNGVPVNRIAKLNPDGTLDTTFNSGTGFNNVVRNIILQPDGKILASGDFTSYNGIGKNRILRLNNTVALSTVDISKNKQVVIYPNPVKDILNIKSDEPISGYEIYSLDGRILTTGNKVNDSKIDVSNLTKGNYLIKFQTKGKEQTTKFIKE